MLLDVPDTEATVTVANADTTASPSQLDPRCARRPTTVCLTLYFLLVVLFFKPTLAGTRRSFFWYSPASVEGVMLLCRFFLVVGRKVGWCAVVVVLVLLCATCWLVLCSR